MKKLLSFIFVLAALTVNAATTVDELTLASFGIDKDKTQSYKNLTAVGKSGAKYTVFAYTGYKQAIQVSTKKDGIGIVTTASSKYVKSITLTMDAAKLPKDQTTKETKEVATSIYASNTAYSDPADLKLASKVAEVKTKTTVTYTFKENYKYVGIAPTSGAAYYTSIKIEWSDEKVGSDPVEWVPDTIQVASVRRLVQNQDAHTHYMVGVVDGEPWINFSTGCLWMHDINSPKDSVQCFKMDNADLKAFTEETLASTIGAGDTILVFANGLSTYTDKNNYTYFETTSAHYVKTIGKNKNRQNITLSSGTATYDNEESLISFSFTSAASNFELTLSDADHSDPNSIAGWYLASAFSKVTAGGKVLNDGKLTLTMTKIDEQGVVSYNVLFASNDYKCEGKDIPLGKFSGDNTNINVARAMEIGNALKHQEITKQTYNIYGYCASVDKKTKGWKPKYPTQTFYLTDTKGSTYGDFEVYNATVSVESAEDTIKAGDFVCVTAPITKYAPNDRVTIETASPAKARKVNPEDAPIITDITPTIISVEEAMAIGNTLTSGAKTPKAYQVRGYIVKIDTKNENTYFMSDDATATYGDFQAYKCSSVYENPKVGDYVDLVGNITRYDGSNDKGSYTNIEIKGGKLTLASQTPIENTVIKAEAVKMIENGQMVIIRNDVRYNVMGNVIR